MQEKEKGKEKTQRIKEKERDGHEIEGKRKTLA